MAAEVLIQGGLRVDLYEAKPSMGRKFLVAGKGGLNLTHSEPLEQFLTRYGARRPQLEPLLEGFRPGASAPVGRDWVSRPSSALRARLSGRHEDLPRCCTPGWRACALAGVLSTRATMARLEC
jgi:predicted flavoprotein YhiN